MSEETKSGIRGKIREQQDFGKKVGLFASKVIAVNPSREEYKDVLGITLADESKADEYAGESKDGNATMRINFWLEDLKSKQKFPVTFFLENKIRENKDATKKQYINNIGVCSWADDVNNLPDWFKKRDYREAYTGEEDFYSFMRTWLGKLDYKDADAALSFEWKQLLKGNLKEIKSQINGEYTTPVVALATVKTIIKEDDSKEYQSVYNRGFLPEYSLKQFRLVDYGKQEVINVLKKKKSSDLKPHERFVLQVSDSEHGCKDSYILKDMKDYNADEFLVGTNAPISSDGAEY